jgi:hypothetical protein
MGTSKPTPLQVLEGHHKRPLRAVMRKDCPEATAVCDILKQERADWDLSTWNAAMTYVLKSEDTVGDWLLTRT